MDKIKQEEIFFNWLREHQENKRLTQTMVDGAKTMLESMGIEAVKEALSKINKWTTAEDGTASVMELSDSGLKLLAQFESFVSKPYLDMVGVWTIGYGNTYYLDGTRVTRNDTPLTEPEAAKLKKDIVNRDFAAKVNLLLADEIEQGLITQNQFDALVCLAYNIGTNGLANSSVIRRLKEGKVEQAADAFRMWNKGTIGNQRVVIKGLVNRREKERELFLA